MKIRNNTMNLASAQIFVLSSFFIATRWTALAYVPTTISVSPQETAQRCKTNLDCPHFTSCPGCVTDKTYTDIPIIHSAKLYFSSSAIQQRTINPLPPYADAYEDFYQTVVPSSVMGWRTQAKLAVQPKSTWGAGCLFGLYERKSHNIVEIPNCVVHHPQINAAVDILSKASDRVKTPAWREDSGGNGLRYVQLSVERMTGKIAMTLIWHGSNLKECQPHLSRLIKECKKLDKDRRLFHSVWCHTNDSLGNAIFARGERNWHPMDGPEFVREVLPGTNVEDREGLLHFTPMAFRQGNMDGFDEIAMHVARSIPGGSRVCELYAGIGLLGLTALVHHGKSDEPLQWLRCSDENPANPRCFKRTVNTIPSEITGRISKRKAHRQNYKKKGKKELKEQELTLEELMQGMLNEDGSDNNASPPADPRGKVSYMVASAASALHEGQALGADVLIVDPPRKGLENEVLTQLCKPYNPKQGFVEDPLFLQGPKYATNWANDVHTIIYVSCGFDALARDCDQLLKGNAGWKLESATGYVLFPGSNHVESVAIFKRKGGRDYID